MPIFEIGDEDATVAMDLQAIRFAVVLHHQFPVGTRINAEDAAVGHIDHIQIAGAVEGRPFEKTVDRVIARRAAGAALRAVAKLLRHACEHFAGNDG